MHHRPKYFKMPKWPIPRGNRDINLGLDRMKLLLEKLGNPHKSLPPIIHVAGTNGKGSTLAYLQAMFESAKYSVHKYISPHLVYFNERITLRGQLISNAMVDELAEECRYYSEHDDIPITFFEGITAMAFLAFSRIPADVLLLEAGMGGGLDATNIVEDVLASVITSISFDHMEFLGDSIPKITYEKAGILKKNGLAIFSWQLNEAMEILLSTAKSLDCETYACGDHWHFNKHSDGTFDIVLGKDTLIFPKPSLLGIHQYINASTAAMTGLRLMEEFDNLSLEHISNGIRDAKWPGRMEKITNGVLGKILPDNIELWFDGAHNEGGIQMIIASFKIMEPKAIIYSIHGRTIHRNMKVFLQYFIEAVELVSCIEIMGEPDSEDPNRIKAVCDELGIKAIVSDSMKDAVLDIIQYHTKYYSTELARIFICGSLFLAGDIILSNKI